MSDPYARQAVAHLARIATALEVLVEVLIPEEEDEEPTELEVVQNNELQQMTLDFDKATETIQNKENN